MNPTLVWRVALAAALSFTLAACGGGGSADGGTGGTGISIGVMTTGSTIVGGVRFDDTTAIITIDDTPKTASIDLRDGMVVKVLGTVNADGVTGTAQRIEAQIEVRGAAGLWKSPLFALSHALHSRLRCARRFQSCRLH